MKRLTFNELKWQADSTGTWLCLRVPRADAMSACEDMIEGKTYEATIKEHRKKRSLDANAYAWVLIGKLADHYGVSPDDVYRQQIRNIGGVYEIIPIREDAIETFTRSWVSGHTGRMVDDLGECKHHEGYHNLRVWFGSSDYDSVQMGRLIDLICDECRQAHIQTMTPDEILNLKSLWREADAR